MHTYPLSGKMTDMSGFSEWVTWQLELRPERDIQDAARALKIRPSELGRWISSKRPPTQDTMRTAARVFNVPIREILIAAEYMTVEESGLTPDTRTLAEYTTDELNNELGRRLGISRHDADPKKK